MGYADGYYYGQGRIICDTSTFSVGDTIRVRSMTDSSKVWNQQVATVGTALVFTVPCYDYYKICTVQTIDDTPTEIGGVYKTVDYGQTLFVNALDKSTLQGMQGVLNAHNELAVYNIGDEIKIKINDGSVRDWIMQVAKIDSTNHAIDLVSKYVKGQSSWYASSTAGAYYADGTARTECQNFYNIIVEQDKQFIKQTQKSGRSAQSTKAFKAFSDYVWLPNYIELFGSNSDFQDSTIPKNQFPIFTTQANRIKTSENGVAQAYWTCDGWPTNDKIVASVTTGGASNYISMNASFGWLLPCFRLTADS